ncbi:MAG: hypothetical protein ACFFG0_07550 [Candidatus Thorarchaeota archaeon]
MNNMKRDWNNYIQSQKADECQLVTALNIYYFLTGKIIVQNSNKYDNLMELCGAIGGSCIHICKVYERLGIKIIKYYKNDYRLEEDNIPLPLDASVYLYRKKYGFHSVAIVDYDKNTDSFRIPNWNKFTNNGWITFKEFNKLAFCYNKDGSINLRKGDIKYRLFKLKNNKYN